MSYFIGDTHLSFYELPELGKRKIEEIINNENLTKLDTEKMDIRIIPFLGEDLKNRYKFILKYIDQFLNNLHISEPGINSEILNQWQNEFFHNATVPDTAISISKKQLIWPIIVIVIEKTTAREYKNDFDEDEAEEIEKKYKTLINIHTMHYEMITRVTTSYVEAGARRIKDFIERHWREYLDIVDEVELDEASKEILLKIILYRILAQGSQINKIKNGVNL